MNLNIYGQSTPSSIQELESNLKTQLDKLNQLKLISQSQNNTQQLLPMSQTQQAQTQNQQAQQRYYLDCGLKEDWDEFLKLNYGITEKSIFDDYKLFLQAKQEIIDEQGRSKLESMKERIKHNKNVYGHGTIGDREPKNVQQPVQQSVQQPVQQPKLVQQSVPVLPEQQPTGPISNNTNIVNGGVVKPNNGLLQGVQTVDNRQGKKQK